MEKSKEYSFKNAKKPLTPFPCEYHSEEFLIPSKHSKDSYICNKCKEERISGRDGIYGILEIIELIQKRVNQKMSNSPNSKVHIEDEVFKAIYK